METRAPNQMKMLKELVEISETVHYVPLSGMLNEKLYKTVFIPSGTRHIPYVLFEDGSEVEIKEYKNKESKECYSYFDLEGKRYVFNIQEIIWFQPGLVYSISMDAVKDFLENRIKERKELFELVSNQLNSYYDFCHPEELTVVAAHAIHTYILGPIGRTPYLLLDGEKNTGKSTLQNVMARLQYHGCFVGKSSIPAMARKIHYLQAAVNLDEFEKLDPTDRLAVVGILNSGAYASGTREIVNTEAKNSANQITVHRTFGAKTFSVNKANFHDSFLSRCIVINTVRNRKPVKDIHGLSADGEQEFQEIRNDLFCYTLKHGRAILKDIEETKQGLEAQQLYGRRTDIFAIILGIIKHFGGEVVSVQQYLNEREALDTEDDAQNDRVYFMLKFLGKLSGKASGETVEFENSDLLNAIMEGLEIDEITEKKYWPTASSVGRMLKRNKLIMGPKERKRVSGKGNIKYLIPKERIQEIIKRSNFDELDPKNSFTGSQEPSIQPGNEAVKDPVKASQDHSQTF